MVLDKAELRERLAAAVGQVVDLLCISDGEATRVLRFYKWDLGKLQVGGGSVFGQCLEGDTRNMQCTTEMHAACSPQRRCRADVPCSAPSAASLPPCLSCLPVLPSCLPAGGVVHRPRQRAPQGRPGG